MLDLRTMQRNAHGCKFNLTMSTTDRKRGQDPRLHAHSCHSKNIHSTARALALAITISHALIWTSQCLHRGGQVDMSPFHLHSIVQVIIPLCTAGTIYTSTKICEMQHVGLDCLEATLRLLRTGQLCRSAEGDVNRHSCPMWVDTGLGLSTSGGCLDLI